MTFNENKAKRDSIDEHIVNCLKDDSSDDVLYKARFYNRLDGSGWEDEVFKQFKNVEAHIENGKNILRDIYPNFEKHNEYEWWEVTKYLLIDGEYAAILSCYFTLDNKLFYFDCQKKEYFPELYQNPELTDVLNCKNIESQFETGEIIIFNGSPMWLSYYAIYVHDIRLNKDNHYLLYCDEDKRISFMPIDDFRRIEKVEVCHDESLNELSRKIKDNSELFYKLLDTYGVQD